MSTEQQKALAPAALIDAVATTAAAGRAVAWAEQHTALVADETARIAAIPAPTFDEGDRAAYTLDRFRELGLEHLDTDSAGNVYGLLPGEGRPAAAFAAHMDTVFPRDLSHEVTRRNGRLYGPSVGDNAAGLAGMLGAVAALRAARADPDRPLWFVATVGEEGLGNLRGVTAATDRLGGEVDAMVAVEGSFFGRLSCVGVGSRRLEIRATAQGGHSWHDFGRPSAVHTLVQVAAAIARLTPPAEPRTTFNIGRIDGGTGVNVIAEEAQMLLDMRSIDAGALDDLTARVSAILDGQGSEGADLAVREVGFRPAGSVGQQHPMVRVCAAVLQRMGVTPQYAPASTDANIPLSRGIPAVTLGVTRGGGAHTRGEWIEVAPLARGVQQLALIALALADRRAGLPSRA